MSISIGSSFLAIRAMLSLIKSSLSLSLNKLYFLAILCNKNSVEVVAALTSLTYFSGPYFFTYSSGSKFSGKDTMPRFILG